MDPSDRMLEEVRKWLSTEGYPLEFETAHALRCAGFEDVTLGDHLADPDEPPREVDVLATVQSFDDRTILRCRVLCECKYATGGPWVLIGGAHDLTPWECVAHTPHVGEPPHDSDVLDKWRERIAASPFFAPFNAAPRALVAMGSKGKDIPYESVQKVSGLARNAAAAGLPARNWYGVYAHTLPCIVLQGRLFRAVYNPDARNIDVEEVRSGRLLWTGSGGGTLVHVVTRDALGRFAEDAKATASMLVDVLADQRDADARAKAASANQPHGGKF